MKYALPIVEYLSQLPAVKNAFNNAIQWGVDKATSWYTGSSAIADTLASNVPSLLQNATTKAYNALYYCLTLAGRPGYISFNKAAYKRDSDRPWADDTDNGIRLAQSGTISFNCGCAASDLIDVTNNVQFLIALMRGVGMNFWLLYLVQIFNRYDLDSVFDVRSFSLRYETQPDNVRLELLQFLATKGNWEALGLDPLFGHAAVRALHPSNASSIIIKRKMEELYDTVMMVAAPLAYTSLNQVDIRAYVNNAVVNPFGTNVLTAEAAKHKLENYKID